MKTLRDKLLAQMSISPEKTIAIQDIKNKIYKTNYQNYSMAAIYCELSRMKLAGIVESKTAGIYTLIVEYEEKFDYENELSHYFSLVRMRVRESHMHSRIKNMADLLSRIPYLR